IPGAFVIKNDATTAVESRLVQALFPSGPDPMKGDDDNPCAINKREVPMKLRGMRIVLATALIACGAASAQDWPARPITMVVPYAAGGPTDVVGRLFAQQMGEILGRQIVVENVPGAGGMTGANRVAHAK